MSYSWCSRMLASSFLDTTLSKSALLHILHSNIVLFPHSKCSYPFYVIFTISNIEKFDFYEILC